MAQDFVSNVFDQAYALREEKADIHKRIGANRDILRALYRSNQLTTEHQKLDKDGNPVVNKNGEPVMEPGGQAAEALELYPTLLGRTNESEAAAA